MAKEPAQKEGLTVVDNPLSHQFEAIHGDEVVGLLTYDLDSPTKTYRLNHTFVPRAHRDRHIGRQLVAHSLNRLRDRRAEVLPVCSFVTAFIEKNPEFHDIVTAVFPETARTTGALRGTDPTSNRRRPWPPQRRDRSHGDELTGHPGTDDDGGSPHVSGHGGAETVTIEPFRILTERLVLRQWSLDDTDDASDIYTDDSVQRMSMPTVPRVADRSGMRDLLSRWMDDSDQSPFPQGRWAIELADTGSLVGGAGLVALPGRDDQGSAPPELALVWHLAPFAVGYGLASEAGHALVHQAFQPGGVDRVFALMHKSNRRSIATAQRVGMEWIAETDEFFNMSLQVYRLLKRDVDLSQERRSLSVTD